MMDGVVRAPSLFSMTLVVLPSITATQELVVPRSMPMIFPMFWISVKRNSMLFQLRPFAALSSARQCGDVGAALTWARRR